MTTPRRAIIASDGVFSYDDLDDASKRIAGSLLADNEDLNQTRVAFLVHPSFAYAGGQGGIRRGRGVAGRVGRLAHLAVPPYRVAARKPPSTYSTWPLT